MSVVHICFILCEESLPSSADSLQTSVSGTALLINLQPVTREAPHLSTTLLRNMGCCVHIVLLCTFLSLMWFEYDSSLVSWVNVINPSLIYNVTMSVSGIIGRKGNPGWDWWMMNVLFFSSGSSSNFHYAFMSKPSCAIWCWYWMTQVSSQQ